ncbi:helix-turn-helix domain-containing protein [Sphingopyxis sp.]|uniref:helix-turn-helix domain-containing protein n=1 Tax=Sphingopyxis sp. TaxID=1908224 RepID=UPI003D6CA80E
MHINHFPGLVVGGKPRYRSYPVVGFSMSNILRSQRHVSDRSDVLANVGKNLRRLRDERDLSQTALAQMSGLSRRMISAIEGGETNVSLASIDRLAVALSVTFSEIVRPPDAADGRRVNSLAWQGKAAGSEARLLGTAPSTKETELWLWSLGPGDSHRSEAHSEIGHEMIFVVDGLLIIEFGNDEFHVAGGDFKIFSSASPCTFINRQPTPVRFVRCVVL